jgi:hypothetical protein
MANNNGVELPSLRGSPRIHSTSSPPVAGPSSPLTQTPSQPQVAQSDDRISPAGQHGQAAATGPEPDDDPTTHGAAEPPQALATQIPSTSASRDEHPNLDNPFLLFPDLLSLRHAITNFAKNHHLGEHESQLKFAAEYEFDEDEAKKEDGFPIAELSKETPFFWQQSRSLKVAVLVVGLLSASCQGFNQSVLNGTGKLSLHICSQD